MTNELWQFPGGIHPPQHKDATTRLPLQKAIIPKEIILPLQQHIGEPAIARVQPGQTVLKGECIADNPSHYLTAPIHASTSGEIIAIEERPIAHPSGLMAPCIIIRPDGKDTWCDKEVSEDFTQLSPQVIRKKIHDAGIAGLGGAGFPTKVKVNPGERNPIETLIINGAECEPFISADDMLMREKADDIISGIEVLRYLLQPKRTVIAIEDNKPKAQEALKLALVGYGIEVVEVPTVYPMGGEKQLIQVVTGKEVPARGIPAQVGVICVNVGTSAAIARAICHGEPMVSRIVTLAGDSLKQPQNKLVLLGTPIAALLENTGCDLTKVHQLIMGGPLMGFTLDNINAPIVKTSNCIIAATQNDFHRAGPEQPCIRCGACADVCPASLLPQQLYWYAKSHQFDRAESLHLFDCIECGACAYVCPSNIPLVQHYRYAKHEIQHQKAEKIKSKQAKERFDSRNARIEREKAERERKRKERQLARAKAKQPKTVDDILSQSKDKQDGQES